MQNDPVWQTDTFSEKERFRREINFLFVRLLRLRRSKDRIISANARGSHEELLRSIKGFDHLMAKLMVRLQRPSGQFVKAKIGGKRILLNKCVFVRKARMNSQNMKKILLVGRINRIIKNLIGFKSSLDPFFRFIGPGPRETLLTIMSTLNRKFHFSLVHPGSLPALRVLQNASPHVTSQGIKRKVKNNTAREVDNKGLARKVAIKKQALQKIKNARYAKKPIATVKESCKKMADGSNGKVKANAKNIHITKPEREDNITKGKTRKMVIGKEANLSAADRKKTDDGMKNEKTGTIMKPENSVVKGKYKKKSLGKAATTAKRNVANLYALKQKKMDDGMKNENATPFLNNMMDKDRRKVKKSPANLGTIKKDSVNDATTKITSMDADPKRSKANQGLLSKKVTKKKKAIKENTLKKAFPKKQPVAKPQPQPVEESTESYVDSIIEEFTELEQSQEQEQDSRDSVDSAASYIDGIILD